MRPPSALLLALVLHGSPVSPEEPGVEWLRRGLALTEAGQFNEALVALDRLKQANPKDPRPYLYSGIALIKAGRKKDAEVELNQVAILEPANAALALTLAQALEDLGRLEIAAEVLSEWEDSAELDTQGLWFLADLYYRLELPDEALRVLEKFAESTPRDSRIGLRRGEIYLLGAKPEEALAAFQKVARAEPNRASAYYGLGRAWQLKQDLSAAREFAAKALELEPGNPDYLQLLGTICDARGESEEALRYLEWAVELPGAPSSVYFDLGNAYRRAGDLLKAQQALNHYRKVYSDKRLRESNLTTLTNQGLSEFGQSAILQAESTFKQALEIDPNHWAAHLNLTKIYLVLGNHASAYEHLQKMQALDPESSEANYFMAFYWYEGRHYSRALTYAEQSKVLRPGQPDLRNLLGNIYFALGQMDEALEEYRAAVRLAPDRFDFRANYESLAKSLGR